MPAASIHDTAPHGLRWSLGARCSAGSMPKLALAWNVTSIYCRGSPDDAFPSSIRTVRRQRVRRQRFWLIP